MRFNLFVSLAALTMLLSGSAFAAGIPEDHADIEGPFATPMEVTETCLECHEDASAEVMGTSHWTWSLEQKIEGKTVMRGKKNSINNFCISVNSNEPRCTSCHVGYGWQDPTFDFTDESRVDCLSCHDTTGLYNKAKDAPAGAGMPPGYTGNAKVDAKPYDLVKMAQNAGTPTRTNCLSCHANGGGGNNVKHGDIDLSLLTPTKATDVHMDAEGNNFSCQDCHETKAHNIKGNAMLVSPGADNAVTCESCHEDDPHSSKRKDILNQHAERIACQTCHIPEFAKEDATKMSWDWSEAKNPKDLTEDQRVVEEHGHKVYIYKKGQFVYEEDVIPSYAWYNGSASAYALGDTIDPTKTTMLDYPLGSQDDANAKIMPFKVHTGKQPYDIKNKIIITPEVWGPKGDAEAFWINFDWVKASTAGMKASGLPFSGEVGFAPTASYWPINHQVSPAKDSLKCSNCHGRKGRLDWSALGYDRDPNGYHGK